MTVNSVQNSESSQEHSIVDVQQTSCCIVGGGPAGAVLALLLARQGIPVKLLEVHKDFDREFRGDTIHPSVMEIMDQLGLAERLLELPHTKVHRLTVQTPENTATLADFSHLKTKYPYITVLPQVKFLEFITTEAKRSPNFPLVMGANVQELIEEDGVIRGIRYRGHGGWHEVRSPLVVGADGRFSRLRQLAGFEPIKTSTPMDVLWFRSVESSRLPRWYRPGLLLIGDAAHVMSPVGGVGINYAIQDAVVAANVLAEPLRRGQLGTAPLVGVQLARELPTRFIQALQNAMQRRLLATASQTQFVALPAWVLR